jgi:hypothetical protein
MRFKLRMCALSLLTIGLIIGVNGCSSKNTSDEWQEDRIVKMIDERRYEEVVSLLEPELAEHPEWKAHLGEAHLGLADFEPLLFTSKILNSQGPGTPVVETLFPHCPSEGLNSFSKLSIRCALKRLIQNLPGPNTFHFARGRELLRQAFPEAAQAPKKYNLLLGTVELASAVSAMGELLKHYENLNIDKVSETEIQDLFNKVLEIATYSLLALERAQHSNASVTRFLTGIKEVEFINGLGYKAGFDPATGVPILIDIANPDNKDMDTDLMRSLVIQNLDRLVEKLKNGNFL